MNTMMTTLSVLSLLAPGGVKTGRLVGLGSDDFLDGLYEIDIDTGLAMLIYPIETDYGLSGMSVAPDGTLYAMFGQSIDELVTIDPDTGEVEQIGPTGFEQVYGLAFDGQGTLYGIDKDLEELTILDTQTGTGSPVGPTGLIGGDAGLTFVPDGTLYAVSLAVDLGDFAESLWTIDTKTGAATELFLLDTNVIAGEICEASALANIGDDLYAVTLIGLAWNQVWGISKIDPVTGDAEWIGEFNPELYDDDGITAMVFLPGAGDADRDGDVDEDDYNFFVECFGLLDEEGKSPYCAFLDADDDGDIDCDDWDEFIPNWTEDTDPPVLPECRCDGDANLDGVVDPLDSGYVLARLGCSVGTGDEDCDAADVNADGVVDPLDSGYVLARFGTCE